MAVNLEPGHCSLYHLARTLRAKQLPVVEDTFNCFNIRKLYPQSKVQEYFILKEAIPSIVVADVLSL